MLEALKLFSPRVGGENEMRPFSQSRKPLMHSQNIINHNFNPCYDKKCIQVICIPLCCASEKCIYSFQSKLPGENLSFHFSMCVHVSVPVYHHLLTTYSALRYALTLAGSLLPPPPHHIIKLQEIQISEKQYLFSLKNILKLTILSDKTVLLLKM